MIEIDELYKSNIWDSAFIESSINEAYYETRDIDIDVNEHLVQYMGFRKERFP